MYRTHDELEGLLVPASATLREAVQAMDKARVGMVIIVDSERRLLGVMSDGDFRRALLAGKQLSAAVTEAMNPRPVVLDEVHCDRAAVARVLHERSIRQIPVVDPSGIVRDVALWLDIEATEQAPPRLRALDCEVVIMAGGKGTRLDPFTRILPKPLIPIGDKPILEIIMDRFAEHGIHRFVISLNHKGRMIRTYLEDLDSGYEFAYLEEEQPLGTAGALKLLPGELAAPFFVTNCDILISADLAGIYEFHVGGGFALTLVGALKEHTVPYGVCEVSDGGRLERLVEKPRYDFVVNTGMYVVSPDVLELIPSGQRFDMTDLIAGARHAGRMVGVYPITDGAWMDVGQWEEYRQTVRRLGAW